MLHSPVLWVWRVEALQHSGLIGDDDDVDAILRACLAGFFAFCRDLSSSGSGNDPIADIGSAKSMGRVVPIPDHSRSQTSETKVASLSTDDKRAPKEALPPPRGGMRDIGLSHGRTAARAAPRNRGPLKCFYYTTNALICPDAKIRSKLSA